jgi:L-ascorbate metabolism protein UlaG (beta-lactamase superfamily)
MKAKQWVQLFLIALAFGFGSSSAQNVKITPLGSHAGELCDRDRATIFEDPTGVRILYDAGHTVTGGDDARLGSVHVVLLSHAHGDHIGDRRMKALEAGTCDNPETVSAAPNSTTAEIAAAKNAAIMMIAPMAVFIGKKVEVIRGKPTGACAQTSGDIVVPLPAPCLVAVQLGGARTFKTAGATRAVEITTVTAAHDSTVPRELLTDPERKSLEADNVSLTLGPSSGYIIQFTNGLKVYLSGDTGIHAEMKSIVNEFHKANLMVLNLGPNAVTSLSGAYAVNELVKPATVIASHVNEGATVGGKVKPGSRTASFIALIKGRPVYLALSGKTMEFDGDAKCVAGC